MLPDRVSNPGPLTYESGALPIALRGPAQKNEYKKVYSRIPVFKLFFVELISTDSVIAICTNALRM